MNLLAIDSATSTLSVALAAGGDAWHFGVSAGQRHSELLMDIVDTLLAKAGLRPEDLSCVTCMGGPGSFTGLRIGFSAAKGLSLALGIPFVPVPTLDCMARPFAFWPGIVAPMIDAKKNAFFCALYRDGGRICPAMDAEPDEILRAISGGRSPALLTGPGAELFFRRLPPECAARLTSDAVTIAAAPAGGYAGALLDLCRERIAQNGEMFNNEDNGCFSGPEYIRKSDAELNMENLIEK